MVVIYSVSNLTLMAAVKNALHEIIRKTKEEEAVESSEGLMNEENVDAAIDRTGRAKYHYKC